MTRTQKLDLDEVLLFFDVEGNQSAGKLYAREIGYVIVSARRRSIAGYALGANSMPARDPFCQRFIHGIADDSDDDNSTQHQSSKLLDEVRRLATCAKQCARFLNVSSVCVFGAADVTLKRRVLEECDFVRCDIL